MLHRYFLALMLSFSFSVAFGQLYYADSDAVHAYDFQTEQINRILFLHGFSDFSQFCINHKTQEMYFADIGIFSGIYDLEGRQIFDSDIEIDISSNTDAMVFDERSSTIYTTEGGTLTGNQIMGSSSGTNIAQGSDLHGLALDSLNNKLYYSDRGTNRLYSVNLDGSENEEIIHLPSGLADPRGVALHPEEGKIYWANTGQKKIQRANLDGSDVEDVISGLDTPENISINIKGNEIYITDIGLRAIFSYSLSSQVLDTLFVDASSYPSSMEFDNNTSWLYWVDGAKETVKRIDVSTKENIGIITTGGSPSSVEIDELQGYIFLSSNRGYNRYNLDGSFGTLIESHIRQDMALDILTEQIYTSDNEGMIRKINYDGTSVEVIYESEDFNFLTNLRFDGLNRALYWLEDGNIYRSEVMNFSKQLFLDFEDNISIFSLDYINSKIYFKSGNVIHYSNFDGSASEPIISTSIFHMVIDPASEQIYYSNNEGIFSSELNGFFEEQFIYDNGISKFTFGSTDGYLLLPTVNTEAKAQTSTNSINLTWTVSSDFNGVTASSVVLGDFEIEKRSEETGVFENIGSVEYKEGTTSYSFIDNEPIIGQNEYRLMYYNTDTELTSYSKYFSTDFTITATNDISNAKELYYNFSNTKFVNKGISGELYIYSLDGQKVDQINVDSNTRDIDMKNLREGMYLYALVKKDNTRIEGRFIRM